MRIKPQGSMKSLDRLTRLAQALASRPQEAEHIGIIWIGEENLTGELLSLLKLPGQKTIPSMRY